MKCVISSTPLSFNRLEGCYHFNSGALFAFGSLRSLAK